MSGALGGFTLAVVWTVLRLPSLGRLAAAGLVVAALATDVAYLATGRPHPPAIGRQVPQAWTRLLGARVAAVLYGARLGIGPATILSTWLWWSGAIIAASVGVWPSVAWGAAFGAVRAMAMVVTGAVVAVNASARMRVLRRVETAVGGALCLSVAIGVGALWFAG